MFLSRTISTLIFFSVNSAEERKKQIRITRPNSFILGPCLQDKERGLGTCLMRLPTATHFSILAWKIPWTEEPGGLQSIGLQRVGHN